MLRADSVSTPPQCRLIHRGTEPVATPGGSADQRHGHSSTCYLALLKLSLMAVLCSRKDLHYTNLFEVLSKFSVGINSKADYIFRNYTHKSQYGSSIRSGIIYSKNTKRSITSHDSCYVLSFHCLLISSIIRPNS